MSLMDAHPSRGALLRLIAATGLVFCSMAIVPPSADALVRGRFGLGNEATSLFFLVHSLPQIFLLGILIGIVSDRIRRRLPLAVVGGIGTGITTMLIPFMPDFRSLIALRFLDGLLGIVAIGMLMTRMVDLTTGANRSRYMAFFLTAIPLGYLAGSLLVASFGDGRFHWAFLLAGGALVVASGFLLVDLRRGEDTQSEQPRLYSILHGIRSTPGLWFPIFFGAVDKFTFGLITLLTGLALSDRYHLSPIVWGGSALGLMWLAYLAASHPAGRLSQRLGPWSAVAVGSSGYGLSLIMLVAFGEPLAFLAFMIVLGAFVAFQTVPTFVLVGDLAGVSGRATAMAAFNLAGSFGLILGLAFAGIASSRWGYLATFSVGGVLELISAVIALFASRIYGRRLVMIRHAGPDVVSRLSTKPILEDILERTPPHV